MIDENWEETTPGIEYQIRLGQFVARTTLITGKSWQGWEAHFEQFTSAHIFKKLDDAKRCALKLAEKSLTDALREVNSVLNTSE